MHRICSWCGKDLDSERDQTRDDKITHGICSLCTMKMAIGQGTPTPDLMERLDEPGFLVDRDGVMQTANRNGCRLVNKEIDAITGRLTGDVLQCANAKLPGGCGHTVKCSVCSIRNSRIATMETGISLSRVSATRNISTPAGEQYVQFIISTDQLDGHALLRIDDVDHPEVWQSPELH